MASAKALHKKFERAVALHSANKFEKAIEAYRSILKKSPTYAPALTNLGQALRKVGKNNQALEYYERATQVPDADFGAWFNLANLQLELKNLSSAEQSYQSALELNSDFAPASYQLGRLYLDRDKIDDALKCFVHAAKLNPDHADSHMNVGTALRELGRMDAAIVQHRKAVEMNSNSWASHYNLALSYFDNGDGSLAEQCLAAAKEISPEPQMVIYAYATRLSEKGQHADSERYYRDAIDLEPKHIPARVGLASSLMAQAQSVEAKMEFSKAVDQAASDASLLALIATSLWRWKLHDDAITLLRKIVRILPDNADAHFNLAHALKDVSKISDAEEECRLALQLEPEHREAQGLLSTIVVQSGQVEEALEIFSDLGPNKDSVNSGELFCSLYSDALSPAEVFSLHSQRLSVWNNDHNLGKRDHSNSPDPERKLRIGYMSADFSGSHPVAQFIAPVLANHSPEQFESIGYSFPRQSTEADTNLKSMCGQWRDASAWSEQRLMRTILDDEIDILVDLSGHTAGGRLPLLRHRPAPVQACYIGYPHSTGLDAIDYFIADAIVSPPELDSLYSEIVMRLDPCVFCFDPNYETPPVDLSLANSRETVTFGSANHVPKLTPTTVRVWSRILHEVPESRLLLKAGPFADNAVQERYMGLFADQGIEQNRLDLHGPTKLYPHLEFYRHFDIGLDPIPYNGGTTTYHSLWMGVPVVTLQGGNFPSRMSSSILSVVGLDDLVAQSEDEYVKIAIDLAADKTRRLSLRASLRETLSKSPACNGKIFTQGLEDLYREMWQRWCKAQPTKTS
jgi:protein O-GlcNAc transferase